MAQEVITKPEINQKIDQKRMIDVLWRHLFFTIVIGILFVPVICRTFPVIIAVIDTLEFINDPQNRGKAFDAVSLALRENWDNKTAEVILEAANRIEDGRKIGDIFALTSKVWLSSYGIDQDYSGIFATWQELDSEQKEEQRANNLLEAFSQSDALTEIIKQAEMKRIGQIIGRQVTDGLHPQSYTL